MADQIIKPPPKYLSFSAILVLAANTMNGPGITTLPTVAADAGRFLYVTLISISVMMAAFVCRRMVYAMWSSVNEEVIVQTDEDYSSMKKVEGGTVTKHLQHLSMDASANEEIIPEMASESQLTHREHDHHEHTQQELNTPQPLPHCEDESLLPHADHEENMSSLLAEDHDKPRPVLERTSIVGQSVEAYGQKASIYTSFLMVASALCLGLAQMMLCAAILDGMFVAIAGQSCALGLPSSDHESFIYCTTHPSMKPYMGSGAPVSLISIGWVIAASASVAMGSVDLDEMMSVQYFLFACLVISAVRFSSVLKGMADGLEGESGDGAAQQSSVNWFVGPNPFQCVGPIMFNFAFIVTSPPSVCLAKKEHIAFKALGMSCIVMGTLYTMVGLSGASVSNAVSSGMIKGGDDTNLLSLILLSGSGDRPSMLDLGMIGLFGFSTVASVPVYCLLAKETLINDAGVAPTPSFLLSNVLPWILVALTYNASFFEAFVNWSGLLILGYSNFSVPLLMDLKLKKVRGAIAVTKKTLTDDDQTAMVTNTVFILVTASITAVIVMSIIDSLILAGLSFVSIVVVMSRMSV